MKKSYNPISDVRNESVDLTKRLYRSILDVAHVLDEQRGRAATITDLFTQNLEAQRMKLRDYCERLMFSDPVGSGRKGEELLWRKGYYDVVASAKRLKKGPSWKPIESCYLRAHIQSGIGHYHHLLMRLQLDFKLDLRGIVDFPVINTGDGLKKGKSSMNSSSGGGKDVLLESGALEWANIAVHRSLIYLGDLSRYLADLGPGCFKALSSRYYYQALKLKPEAGMPHNQLGTLSGNSNFSLDAAYHYMRCMMCSQTFEGSEGNLSSVLERNTKWLEESASDLSCNFHHLIVNYLYFVDICLFNKTSQHAIHKVCEEVLMKMEVCLSESEPMPPPQMNNDTDSSTDLYHLMNDVPQAQHINDDVLFKISVITLMCYQHCREKGSSHTNTVAALLLTMVSQLIQKLVQQLETVLPSPQPLPVKSLQLNGHCKRRRRRRRRKGSIDNSSDLSEDDDVEIVSSDSDMSEEELVFDVHSSDSETDPDKDNMENGIEINKSIYQLVEHSRLANNPVLLHVEKICQEGFLLQTIKVCCDWLCNNLNVLRSCRNSSKTLLSRLVSMLNHFTPIPMIPALSENDDDSPVESSMYNGDITKNDESFKIPLAEDVDVQGLMCLKIPHAEINWNMLKTHCLTPKQEAFVRICKVVCVGRQLAASDATNMTFDPALKWFSITTETSDSSNGNAEQEGGGNEIQSQRQGKLMHDMGQLWLRAEVRELETKVKRTTNLPPYLVCDCDAFVYHSPLVKQLVNSRKFIVLIPSVVVSALDEQKRVSRRVRDTIRWLEAQFRHGNRFLRAQRSNERLPLPLIKYPKKKDKEAWLFFQVVECCHFLSQTSIGRLEMDSNKEKDSFVTLVTGSKTLLSGSNTNGFSPLGVTNSAGVSLEHIETFHSKWKSSSKSHG